MDSSNLSAYAALGVIVICATAYALYRRRLEARHRQELAAAVSRNLHQPASLHPEIDATKCIGSLSCLRACPEGDILGIVDGKAKLIRGANCIGHGRCALECPVSAIRLVVGTEERGVDLPEIDANFESSRAGVHVVGELGGMGLIRNSVTQGLEVVEALASRRGKVAEGAVEVAIVGAGPAGLATALACRKAGLSFRLLEQDTVGGTIAHYPRQKIVMTDPLELPFFGHLKDSLLSKEDLLALWHKAIAAAELKVEEGVQVSGIEGADGDFAVQTGQGPVKARKVVLATGRRGTPRKLGAPGEQLDKVAYRLVDPEQYAGSKVLVVGGGDSALEAAMAVAEETDAEVTLSYRNEALGRCRDANRQKFEAHVAKGRIRALWSSQVSGIGEREATLTTPGGPVTLPNDYVLVSIGGELPLEFLQKMGVGVRRFHGEELRKDSAAAGPGVRETRAQAELRRRRRIAAGLAFLGACIVALLALKGGDYYLLPLKARFKDAMHAALKPAGLWGHGVGVVATAFMLSNFLYPMRKRLGFMKGRTTIRTWLTFHMFVGFMSPLVILFHAAFQANNDIARWTLMALLIVVSTGVVGRFVFGLVPAEGDAALEEADVLAELERSKGQILAAVAGTAAAADAKKLMDDLAAKPPGSFVGAVLSLVTTRVRLSGRLATLARALGDPERSRQLRQAAERLARLRVQARFLGSFKRLLSGWRLFHAVLALFLVVAIAGHIGLSFYLGYRWIF
ncbi:MAG TPA: NAD(P)-binding domain-containing protein [Myxococcales bacterium]|jgi:thioredoxin reductase/NAD-dependent dihydropyrimidine dehydrogenase PreA subunit